MIVRACRGICIGVGKHLVEGETADLDAALVQYLLSIKAVEKVEPEPAPVVEAAAPPADPPAGTEETEKKRKK